MTVNRNTPLVVKNPVNNKIYDISALFIDDENSSSSAIDFDEAAASCDNAIKFITLNIKLGDCSLEYLFHEVIYNLFTVRDIFNKIKELKPSGE